MHTVYNLGHNDPCYAKKMPSVIALFFNNTTDNFTHEHHQMVNIEIRLIAFFVVEDGEAVYSQQK